MDTRRRTFARHPLYYTVLPKIGWIGTQLRSALERGATLLACAGVCLVVCPSHAEPPKPLAHTLSMSLGFGVGTASMDAFHRGAEQYIALIEQTSDVFRADHVPTSGMALLGEVRLRYYLPHNLYVESGLGLLYHSASTPIQIGPSSGFISYTNTAFEIPFVIGWYKQFWSRFHLHGGLGPSLLLFPRSDWQYNLGRVTNFSGTSGGGLELAGGVDYLLLRGLSVSLSIRYRFTQSGDLRADDPGILPVPPVPSLDYSGISATLALRYQLPKLWRK